MTLAHHNALLRRQRCCACAEPIPALLALRGGECPHCAEKIAWRLDSGDVPAALTAPWRARATALYALLAVGSLLGATVPLLQSAIFIAALLIAHLGILRPALGWLSTGRRVFARISLKLIAAIFASFNLVIDVLLAPLVGVRSLVLAGLAVLGMALYLELSQAMLRRRIVWDHDGRPLAPVEWGAPSFALGALLLVVVGGSLATVWALNMAIQAEIPGLSELAAWLLGRV